MTTTEAKTAPNPQPPQATKRPYTPSADTQKYLVMVEKSQEFVLKENSPENIIFKVIKVVPELQHVSFDRGEYADRFYVIKFTKDSNGKLTPVSDPFDPCAGAFYEYCKDFCEKYKVAT